MLYNVHVKLKSGYLNSCISLLLKQSTVFIFIYLFFVKTPYSCSQVPLLRFPLVKSFFVFSP